MRARLLVPTLLLLTACAQSPGSPPAGPPSAAVVIDGPSGKLLQKLPGGLASPSGKSLYWVGGAHLHATDTASGKEIAALPI